MLNNIGLPGLLLIAVVVLVLFGRGKISSLMGEVGKGITAFKRGVKDSSDEVETASTEATRDLPGTTTPGVTPGTMPGERARDVTPTAPVATPSSSQTTDRN
ncbi:MAG: twin-arginine translocase TatA/TatE family subunit [Paracoccus sp. (in: a-proteobacteria)]